jgi:hypothetical protein
MIFQNGLKKVLTFFARSPIISSSVGGLAPDLNQKDYAMSNYTDQMVAKIKASAPLNLAKAQALSADFGNVTYRSVISKAKSLGVEYVKAAPAAKKSREDSPTKAAYLAAIRKGLALPDREGDLTKAELATVLESIG